MPKSFKCRDVGVNCNFEAKGETVEDVMKQTTAHAKTAHGYDPIPVEMESKIRGAIRDVARTGAGGARG